MPTTFRTVHYKSITGSSGRLGMALGGGPLLNANKDGGGRQGTGGNLKNGTFLTFHCK